MNEPSLTKRKVIFCQNLIYYRRLRCFTQEELSRMSEVHRTHISCLEQGVANPSLETIIKLAIALQVEPWELLFDRESRKQPVRKK